MNKLKFYGFEVVKSDVDEIEVAFKVKYLKGVDLIVSAFQAGKNIVEGALASGLMGFLNIAGNIYNWIKAGRA